MPQRALVELHKRTVEIEMHVANGRMLLSGVASYDARSDRSGELRILVSEPTGDIAFLFDEAHWTGEIEDTASPGCDFRIRLNAPTQSISR